MVIFAKKMVERAVHNLKTDMLTVTSNESRKTVSNNLKGHQKTED
jgi:hypothetical protein